MQKDAGAVASMDWLRFTLPGLEQVACELLGFCPWQGTHVWTDNASNAEPLPVPGEEENWEEDEDGDEEEGSYDIPLREDLWFQVMPEARGVYSRVVPLGTPVGRLIATHWVARTLGLKLDQGEPCLEASTIPATRPDWRPGFTKYEWRISVDETTPRCQEVWFVEALTPGNTTRREVVIPGIRKVPPSESKLALALICNQLPTGKT